jgi:hypothetical protein
MNFTEPGNVDVKKEKQTGRVEWRHRCQLINLDSLGQKNTYYHPPKNEPFSQEKHLKIQLSRRGLKLSNSKPGCVFSALNFFGKHIQYHQWFSDIELIQITACSAS